MRILRIMVFAGCILLEAAHILPILAAPGQPIFGPDRNLPLSGSGFRITRLKPDQLNISFAANSETCVIVYRITDAAGNELNEEFIGKNYKADGHGGWSPVQGYYGVHLQSGTYLITAWSKLSRPDPSKPWKQIHGKLLKVDPVGPGRESEQTFGFDDGGVLGGDRNYRSAVVEDANLQM